jgi:hypothetical protein
MSRDNRIVGDRITYESKGGMYRLNPGDIFGVVSEMNMYSDTACDQAMRDNPDYLRPSCELIGYGRELKLVTETVGQFGSLTCFDLARLVLSEDGDRLKLVIGTHERVFVPSDDLYDIAQKYMIRSDS